MALKTTRSRTRAALGTDADDTDAAVEVKLLDANGVSTNDRSGQPN